MISQVKHEALLKAEKSNKLGKTLSFPIMLCSIQITREWPMIPDLYSFDNDCLTYTNKS